MTFLIILLVLLTIAGIGKSIMDTLQFHFSASIFKNKGHWWNPKDSWKNKYKNRDPNQGEAFPGSTTIFVFVTDAWHFFQFIFLQSLFISIIMYRLSEYSMTYFGWWGYIIDFLIMSILFRIVFQLFYKLFSK
ncbi:MAG: hypothetical protein H8E51_08590 [Bacteroidetes bacterium]|nr:hypothetical protein [Bacteroidota bacterium]